jgi:hypothetical protein
VLVGKCAVRCPPDRPGGWNGGWNGHVIRTKAPTSKSSATAIEHIRPPRERPPMATRLTEAESRSASVELVLRTVSMHTAGESGRRVPKDCLGSLTRSIAMPSAMTELSMATSRNRTARA